MMVDNTARLAVLKEAAALTDLGYGEWAYDEWVAHNERYFDGALEIGGINWGLTSWGRTLGQYWPERNVIVMHVSLLYPQSDAWGISKLLGVNFASDVLMHEMVHQAIRQRGDIEPDEKGHNNQLWVDEINRIALLLGLKANAKVVKQRRVDGQPRWVPEDGCLTRKQLGGWPHSARLPTHYEETAVMTLGKKARFWENGND